MEFKITKSLVTLSFNAAGLIELAECVQQQAQQTRITLTDGRACDVTELMDCDAVKIIELGPYKATRYTKDKTDTLPHNSDGLLYDKWSWHLVSDPGLRERKAEGHMWSDPGENGVQQVVGYFAKLQAMKELSPKKLLEMVVGAELNPTDSSIDQNGLYR